MIASSVERQRQTAEVLYLQLSKEALIQPSGCAGLGVMNDSLYNIKYYTNKQRLIDNSLHHAKEVVRGRLKAERSE